MKSSVKDKLLQSSSEESASEDDEEAWKLTEDVEKKFFKTLSQIKSKDPKIYEKNVEFFKDVPIPQQKPKEKTKSAPLTLREYERKIIVEKGGELSDEDPKPVLNVPLTYVEEQRAIKNSLKAFIQSDSEYESEAEWGGLFKKRRKTKKEEEKEDIDYKEWLKGQKSEVQDKKVAEEMKPLRDFWTNPDLDEEDQFLRDYILNKKFLENDDKGDSGVDLDKLHEESEEDKNEDHLEKNSHRFEELDQEFIKRYPRVMENSVRRKDDSRSRKRKEIKERKLKEKEKKRTEIKKKQKLKKQEIEEKIEELKKLTGNDKLAFENVLDKDFDINEHEKAMQRLFNEEFYSQDDPNFIPDHQTSYEDVLDEEVVEDVGQDDEEPSEGYVDINAEPQCEDPDFNMDCDYDPAMQKPKEKSSRSRRRKDKHRRTTVSEAVRREKPVFDPATHKTFQDYVDQYYSIDCEDFIGDLPCRFKYRSTVPNSYGLTIEEILAADSKELERWCSIKRIQELKPSYKEKCDAKVFRRRAANEELKRKILPSLYKTPDKEESLDNETKSKGLENESNKDDPTLTLMDNTNVNSSEIKTGNGNNQVPKNKKRAIPSAHVFGNTKEGNTTKNLKRKSDKSETRVTKKRKTYEQENSNDSYRKNKKVKNNKNEFARKNKSNEKPSLLEMSDARLQAYGIKPKRFRNKFKYSKENTGKNESRTRNDTKVQVLKNKKKMSIKQSGGTFGAVIKDQDGNKEKLTKIKQKDKNNKNKFANNKESNIWVVSKS